MKMINQIKQLQIVREIRSGLSIGDKIRLEQIVSE